jgi:hypothetical protein
MPRIDSYKHLDGDSKVSVELSMEEIAQRVCALNYGAHRLLSAMAHELRKKNDEFIESCPDCKGQRSPLADAIEELLNKGYYF